MADKLISLVCSPNQEALFILRGLIREGDPVARFNGNSRVEATGTQAATLVEAILKPKTTEDCPVSAALTEDDKAALREAASCGEPSNDLDDPS